MGKKQRRKIARAFAESCVDKVKINSLQGTLHAVQTERDQHRRNNDVLGRKLRHIADGYHRELARYKFIDDILSSMRTDPEFSGMPLFKYMRGEHYSVTPVPDGYRDGFPPIMHQAIMPELTWTMRDTDVLKSMTQEVLSYYLFRYWHGEQNNRTRRPAPMVEYECAGVRRAFFLPSGITKLPEAEALQFVMREIAPAVLAMFKEIAERG